MMKKNIEIDFYNEHRVRSPHLFEAGVSVTHGYFDVSLYLEVLAGKRVAYIAKGVVPKYACHAICDSYIKYKDKHLYQVKPCIESIGHPLYFADQNTIKYYFRNADHMQDNISDFFKGAGSENYSKFLFDSIKDYCEEEFQLDVRKIKYENKNGFFGIIRSWGALGLDEKGRATRLHEDRLQLRLHNSLETRDLINSPLASTCIYYSNGISQSGGELKIYDIRPGLLDAKEEEFSSKFKYGFSENFIENIPFLTIEPEAGDVVTFLSDRLHEVFGVRDGHRINSTFFSGITPDKKTNLIWS